MMSDWISVDDSLPETDGVYLCHFSDGLIETFPYPDSGSGLWGVHNVVVTHWMELPGLPNGGK
jgi:hypothetical protein